MTGDARGRALAVLASRRVGKKQSQIHHQLKGAAEPAVAADGAGITAFRTILSLQPTPLLNIVRHHSHVMKSKVILIVSVLALASSCAVQKDASARREPRSFEVTIPNGSSPAKANAPHAPMNDDLRTRNGWNHGNGVLWTWLNAEQFIVPKSDMQKDGSIDIKFGWWRGIRGRFSISGRRLDAPAPPLRYSIPSVESYGDFGFLPSGLIFPTDGYWEITGHIDDQSLTFVVHVIKKDS